MVTQNQDNFPIREWDILPIEVYKIVLSEQKEAFSMYSAEMQSITDKSIRLLTTFVTFISASAIYIFGRHGYYLINSLIAVFSILIAIGIYNIFKGHYVHYKGTSPNKVLTADFDNALFTNDDKNRLIYRNLIQQYLYKTDEMSSINSRRVSAYDKYLGLSIAMIIAVSCYLGVIW